MGKARGIGSEVVVRVPGSLHPWIGKVRGVRTTANGRQYDVRPDNYGEPCWFHCKWVRASDNHREGE